MIQRGSVVVITGASAGVGRATARAFAERGCKIALLARGRQGLEGAKRDVEQRGGEAITIPTDVAEMGQVDAAAEEAEQRLGPIDIWVNGAMTTVFARFADITADEFERATRVTYLGAVHGTMAALHRMLPRDRGKIVQVGSALSYRAIPLQSAYCGAKFAIRGFTDSLRCELIHDGSNVRITMVQLPGLNTPQFQWCRSKLPKQPQPVPPIYQPEVAAEGIVFAAEQDRREVYVGASAVATIRMAEMSPHLVDRYLARTGFGSQQDDSSTGGRAPTDNLFTPVEGDYGAHGIFDSKAKDSSMQLWAVKRHAGPLGNLMATLAGSVKPFLSLLKSSPPPDREASPPASRDQGRGEKRA